jgi:hypothetical protein
MAFRRIVTACAAAALMASGPVAAQSAAPLSVAHSPAARAGAPAGDENLRGNSLWLYVGIAAVILVVLWATDTWPFDDDDSDSP